MNSPEIQKLISGFRLFREKYFQGNESVYEKLSSAGQNPKTLIIGCSDSRVDPAIISSASPGEIFVVRNVANLGPPYEANSGFHGVSAAIEFAVVNLKVENILVLGHRQCGGIRSLFTAPISEENGFVQQWMKIAEPAKNSVLKKFPEASEDTLCRKCEMESITTSLSNLRSFPFVTAALASRPLTILGIYFDLELGQLFSYDEVSADFKEISL